MLKKSMFMILFILLISFDCNAGLITVGGQSISVQRISPEYTTSVAVLSGKLAFGGIIIKTDGTNNVTLNVYDSVTATGTKLIPTDSIILGTSRLTAISFSPPLRCGTGIYVSVSVAGGGSCSYQVIYDAGE